MKISLRNEDGYRRICFDCGRTANILWFRTYSLSERLKVKLHIFRFA